MDAGQPYYRITTAYGTTYVTDQQGNVLRYGGLVFDRQDKAHQTWRFTGLWYHGPWAHIRHLPLSAIETIKDWTLKNGRPRYGITDIDHGTHRLHGNKEYHGIRYACRTDSLD